MVTALKVNGIDISHHQNGTIDYNRAKLAGLEFVYHKATEGNSFVDENYPTRRRQAAYVKLPFGAYHFARPEVGDAAAEAKFFLDRAKPKPGDLLPVLDLEDDGGLNPQQLDTWARTFVETVTKLTGFRVMVYTPFALPSVGHCPLWVARYSNSNTPPVIPKPWHTATLRQFSNGQYGVPRMLDGVGAVDLNTYGPGASLQSILIPKAKPTKPVKKKTRLDVLEVSMQFSDTPAQMEADVKAIFARAVARKLLAVMGTEAGAGAGPLRELLKKHAKLNGYHFWMDSQTDAWYAVQQKMIKPNTFVAWSGPVIIPGKAKSHTAKKATSVSFFCPALNRTVSLLCGHYLTHGRPVKNPEYNKYLPENTQLAKAMVERGVELAEGTNIVIISGDSNIDDRQSDVFLGQGKFRSVADQLKAWQNTGHGPIDFFATYLGDKMVEPVYFRALDDTEFFLNTDHWAIEAGFDVEDLAA